MRTEKTLRGVRLKRKAYAFTLTSEVIEIGFHMHYVNV